MLSTYIRMYVLMPAAGCETPVDICMYVIYWNPHSVRFCKTRGTLFTKKNYFEGQNKNTTRASKTL